MYPPAYVFNNRAELLVARDAWCSDPSAAATTYGDVNTWDISAVTDISFVWCKGPRVQDGCNADCANFNDDIGNWDVSKVTNMDQTFREAYDFNQDINNWDTSKVTNMQAMFQGASSIDQNFENWNIAAVNIMGNIFYNPGRMSPCNEAKTHASWSAQNLAIWSTATMYSIWNTDLTNC